MAGRLLAISDLHIGYPENRAYADALSPGDPGDWLIVAGDVGEVFADVGFVLASLANRFAKVIWTPGNHELWTLPSDPVALRGAARYEALVKVCRRFGVVTPEDEFPVWDGPDGPVTVAPLFTLYDYSFRADGTPVGDDPAAAVLAAIDEAVPDDGKAAALATARKAGIKPVDEGRLHADPYPSAAAWCRDLVGTAERRLAAVTGPVVLVSHWPLVRGPVDELRHPAFAPWCGTTLTAGWPARHKTVAAVYGHLHIPRTTRHDGVRFEEVSVGYPREWQHRGTAPPSPRVILEGSLPPPAQSTWRRPQATLAERERRRGGIQRREHRNRTRGRRPNAVARPDFSAIRWAAMSAFPSPVISSARLDLRAYSTADEDRVRDLLGSGGEPEALPPGMPSDPDAVAGWLADGVHRPQREGTGVHLMMLDRTAGRIVGSISLFHADWEVRAAEIGYGVRGDEL